MLDKRVVVIFLKEAIAYAICGIGIESAVLRF